MPIETETPSTIIHFGGVTPFKVQVNFDIPLFEGQIDADALEKWLSLLEGYFFVQKFSNTEKTTFMVLKSLPMSEISVKITMRNMSEMSLQCFGQNPPGKLF